MESNSKIHHFLNRVQAKWNRVLFIQITFTVLIVLAGSALVFGSFSYFQSPLLSFGWSVFIIILLGCYIHSFADFSGIDREKAALLTEAKYPELNNSLINAIQLEFYLTNQQSVPFSQSLIREQLERTQTKIQKLNPDSVVSGQKFIPLRNLFLVTFLLLIAFTTLLPDFWKS